MWLTHPELPRIVQQAWYPSQSGSAIFRVAQKLEFTATTLRRWNRDVFGHVPANSVGELAYEQVQGTIQGIRPQRSMEGMPHLFFADDSLLLLEATAPKLNALRRVMGNYEAVSGQQINFEKSSILFSRNTLTSIQDHFFGLPICWKYRGRQAARSILARIRQRMQGQMTKFLSPAGNETLTKPTLSSTPVNTLSCMTVSKEMRISGMAIDPTNERPVVAGISLAHKLAWKDHPSGAYTTKVGYTTLIGYRDDIQGGSVQAISIWTNIFGAVVIITDHGQIVGIAVASMPRGSPLRAEGLACRTGLLLTTRLGYSIEALHTDSSILHSVLIGSKKAPMDLFGIESNCTSIC
ncbi:hypothetical protein CRG98_029180 [Punica granatum]|uniref:RNase H type-1 domain-containing protein n=1 Tax=Punica granatum TaxID=22663 RepID=A0A2I0J3C4_PUNGR|nr:hypothetical protein CRG98_029180 [Punica granatum]